MEEKSAGGDVLLTYPLILRPWFLHLARGLGLRTAQPLNRKLQLDEMGSLTWALLDGERTVQDMAEQLVYTYNLNQREAEIAVTSFLRQLGQRGIIGFLPPSQRESEEST